MSLSRPQSSLNNYDNVYCLFKKIKINEKETNANINENEKIDFNFLQK